MTADGRPRSPQAPEAPRLVTDDDAPPVTRPDPPPRRRWRHGWLWGAMTLVLVVVLGGIAQLGVTGKPIRMPIWVVAEAEARVNRMLRAGEAPGAQIALGGAVVVIDEDFVPRLHLEDVRLMGASGRSVATLPEVRIGLAKGALLGGTFRPKSLRIVGAQITLRRMADGRFDLAFGGETDETGPESFAELLDRVDAVFRTPALSALDRIEAEALTLTLDDRRAGRVWQVGDGRLRLDNRPDELALELGMGLVGGGTDPARATLTFISPKGSSAARVSARVDQMAAADVATQAPALAWLSVLDAPISGTIAAEFDEAGAILRGSGTLDIGAGGLHPASALRPVPFNRFGLSFALDQAGQTISFSDLSIDSDSLRLKASGVMRAPGLSRGDPNEFIGQVQVADLKVDPEGLFETPAKFSRGAIDFRLRLAPFQVDLGQISLTEGATRLNAKGSARADASGWSVALDVALNEIRHDALLALWPRVLVPKTRAWLAENVQQGLLFDVKGGVRLHPGTEPLVSLGYEFAAADVRFLRTLPPIRDGYGYSTLIGTRYTVVLDRGGVTPPVGGRIDASGSVFKVLDITQKPADAEITLKTRSSITAALSLLDEPPFGFLTRAGFPVDIAEGRAETTAVMRLPLRPKVGVNDVKYDISGVLTDVTSDRLVSGRMLRAARLRLAADNTGIEIGGPGTLGKARFDATWRQDFGPQAKGRSQVGGSIDITQATLDEFGVVLPQGSVSGAGQGRLDLDLVKGGGSFRITSDLRGVALAFAPIDLSKPADTTAELEIEGRLGQPPSIDLLRLASGKVEVEGSVALRPDGGLDVAQFGRVISGDWLAASVDITGQGKGVPVGVAITGGRVDLRRLPANGGAGEGGVPIDVVLDTLQVTQGIALTDLQGRFQTRGGPDGSFTASVNGAAPVQGVVMPSSQGTAVRIRSEDAGAVLSASGIFKTARGGSLDLTLRPRGPRGAYDGSARLANIQIRDAPVLAELLGAISVIGLLEQLNDSGLVFTSAEADFTTSADRITISRGSAVGASLGVSMAGSYDTRRQTLDMQGVISPIYILNGIGSVVSKPGEGLFGFNYDLTGSVDDPQVAVNPLSILTPGGFREIFRGDAPRRDPPKRNEFR